jgi:GTPase
MSQRQLLQWGVATTLVMTLLGGCGGASPTPIVIVPAAASTSIPPNPTAVLPRATDVPPTEALPIATIVPSTAGTDVTTTADGTATLGTVPATEDPSDQPFLMKIDRVSVIVGRGTLLEGSVLHGTLQGNDSVEILGPQNTVLGTTVLAVLISNTVRDHVTVGDHAGILVQSIEASGASPGMLLTAAGAFDSYEEALQELQ